MSTVHPIKAAIMRTGSDRARMQMINMLTSDQLRFAYVA